MPLFTRRRPSGSRRIGAGEPVLLLHPYMLSHHSWRPVIEHLRTDHDVLAVSMAGHYGGPPLSWFATMGDVVDLVEAELDRVGWDTAHVVGNSLGGWVALELARRGRARTVTAIAPAGGFGSLSVRDAVMTATFLTTATLRSGFRFVGLLPRIPFASRALATVAADPSQIAPEDVRHIVRTALGATHPLQVLAATARSVSGLRLEEIEVPVHLVFCEEDAVIPPAAYAPWFTERLPDAKVTRLPGVGHCPQMDEPALVAALVRETVAAGSHDVVGPLAASS